MWLLSASSWKTVLSDGCFFTHSPRPVLFILPECDDIQKMLSLQTSAEAMGSGGFLFVCFNLNCELQNNLKSSFPTSLTPNSPKPFIHSPWPLVEAGKYSSILQNTVHWTVTPEAIF